MPLQIDFDDASIIMQVPNVLDSHRESIQIDGLKQVFLSLRYIAKRLDTKTTVFTEESANYSETDLIVSINSIATDIWSFIEQARRLLMFDEQVNLQVPDQKYLFLLNQVKKVRDSFNHLEGRLPNYFFENGQSILGDISWHYRASRGEADNYLYLRTGSTIHQTEMSDGLAVTVGEQKFKSRVGVYKLSLHYVKQDKKQGPYTRTTINLEDVCSVINLAIATVEAFFAEKLAHHDMSIRKNVPLLLRFSE